MIKKVQIKPKYNKWKESVKFPNKFKENKNSGVD